MGEPGDLRFDVAYPDRLSRGLLFVKWLLIIPHAIILYFLGIAWAIVTLVAWFAILATGNYPKGLFDFAVGYNRWNYRAYLYLLLLTDVYPPFSTGPDPVPLSEYLPYAERAYGPA